MKTAASLPALALTIGIAGTPAIAAYDSTHVRWMTGVTQNVLSDEAMESYRLISEQCRKPHIRLCELAVKNAIEFTRGGLRWMDANPAPACLQPVQAAMHKWLNTALEGKETYLAGSEHGDFAKMQRGINLMRELGNNHEPTAALDRANC